MKWNERKYNHEKPETVPGLISIVMPTFNRRAFLPARIDEIVQQSYTNWELIVVNDGGEDVSELFKDVPNTRYINLSKNSKSVSIPRNVGISYARGEFICPADDDVEINKYKLEILVNNIDYAPLCYGNRLENFVLEGKVKAGKVFTDWNPLEGSGVDNGQLIYRKSVYEKIPYIVSTHACDYHLAKEIYSQCGPFKYVDETVCEYIWHGSNRSHSPERKKVPLLVQDYKNDFNVHNDIKIVREE